PRCPAGSENNGRSATRCVPRLKRHVLQHSFLEVYRMPDYCGSECTVVHVLRDQLSKDPVRIWIVTEEDKYSVADMDGRSSTLARSLSGLGVSADDTVLVMLPNCIEFIDCWLALAKLRAIQVPVNTAYFGMMLEHLVRDSGATRIVVHAS